MYDSVRPGSMDAAFVATSHIVVSVSHQRSHIITSSRGTAIDAREAGPHSVYHPPHWLTVISSTALSGLAAMARITPTHGSLSSD